MVVVVRDVSDESARGGVTFAAACCDDTRHTLVVISAAVLDEAMVVISTLRGDLVPLLVVILVDGWHLATI